MPEGVYVTGPTALTVDLDEQLNDALPLFIGATSSCPCGC